ncbi:16S rRNA pseudouridine(516) synthase [Polynucleobacter sp. MWH-Spelu-300-X4]|uniref:pseudouridine synthase n=1 Tax=Polynucleobacter sp. MWH-Spelu-300-X4 TaxID=2689109 RepID=UPI001BFEDA28|nr:16S rRNA pseudouridine(516) synthase [Polynucleobacter sp. MWH-Spelu-300-X4]QWD79049.1 16S rRNA pseudouridine(516) synthase [Polynucleobacter sp. MWH-Spelu-300-X4]
MAKPLTLEKILFSQGFGTRRYCSDLVYADLVKVNGVLAEDPEEKIPPENLQLEVDGQAWEFHEKAYVAFHKPVGYECSHKTSHHPSVYGLLPQPLIERGIQCVGRLDWDTTGLLLLSDDGQFIHKMTSPKKNIGKIYDITTAEPITQKQIDHLLNGVILDDDPKPCFAKACVQKEDKLLAMTIVEGRYHQVKRMLAAAGNHVAGLHRSTIGAYTMPTDLAEGQWRWLYPQDLQELGKNIDIA